MIKAELLLVLLISLLSIHKTVQTIAWRPLNDAAVVVARQLTIHNVYVTPGQMVKRGTRLARYSAIGRPTFWFYMAAEEAKVLTIFNETLPFDFSSVPTTIFTLERTNKSKSGLTGEVITLVPDE